MKHQYFSLGLVFGGAVLLSACGKIPKLGFNTETEEGTEAKEAVAPIHTEIVRDLHAGGYDAFTATKGRLVVVDFHASWCGPCRSLGPKLVALANEYDGKVLIGKVDVDQEKVLAGRLGVRSIPDVRIFRDGRQVDAFVGDPSMTDLRTRLKGLTSQIADLPKQSSPAGDKADAGSIEPMKKDWMPEGIQKL